MIETERLLLREMTIDDFDALYKVLSDTKIMRYYPYTFDEAKVRWWIERNIERYKTFGFGLWAVCLKDTGEMIGDCGLSMQNINGVIKPEIGYHIRADKQKQGFGSEAARAVRDWCFESTPFRTIYSYMPCANIPSQATAKANGMKMIEIYNNEGVDTAVYAITREEWERIS